MNKNPDLIFFKGYEEDDRDVVIRLDVEINENKEEFTDFFWIIQRYKKVYEGEIECVGSGRNENCYEAKRKRRIGKNQGNVTYELELRIDTLEKEDIELKVFLIKDFRNFNSKVDQFEVFSVPRSTASAGIIFSHIFSQKIELLYFSIFFSFCKEFYNAEFSFFFADFPGKKSEFYTNFFQDFFLFIL